MTQQGKGAASSSRHGCAARGHLQTPSGEKNHSSLQGAGRSRPWPQSGLRRSGGFGRDGDGFAGHFARGDVSCRQNPGHTARKAWATASGTGPGCQREEEGDVLNYISNTRYQLGIHNLTHPYTHTQMTPSISHPNYTLITSLNLILFTSKQPINAPFGPRAPLVCRSRPHLPPRAFNHLRCRSCVPSHARLVARNRR